MTIRPTRLLSVFRGSLLLLIVLTGDTVAETLMTATQGAPPNMELPKYLTPAIDPALGLTLVRVTEPLAPLGAGLVCKLSYCSHRYSSAQAWNADQSLLLISNGCNGFCFLDGQTYAPQFRRERADRCEWHPTEPNLMICVGGGHIALWTPRTNTSELVFETEAYRNLQFGPNKGNPSLDGSRIVVRAIARDGSLVAFAYDLVARRKFNDIPLKELPGENSYCGISPLGRYIFCQQYLADETDQAFIFDIEGRLVQAWTENHRPGHGDMTVDDDGTEVYVGISKSVPDKYQVIKRRLYDGRVTALAPYGEAQHASTRATRRPGWVFVSYAGQSLKTPLIRLDAASFIQEVIALRIDGSGEMRRVAYTRNPPHDYWSETHASPSPDGSQIIWSSNWNRPGGPVYDFVTRLNWSDEKSKHAKQ